MRPVSGGTDTHLALIDLRPSVSPARTPRRLRRGSDHAEQERDPLRPAAADGAIRNRVGSPSVTTQGMGPEQMAEVTCLIGRAVRDVDGSAAAEIADAVSALTSKFPAYPHA